MKFNDKTFEKTGLCKKKNATELITNVLIGFRLFIVIY